MFETHKDDVFMLSGGSARRHEVAVEGLAPFHVGAEIRDWQSPGYYTGIAKRSERDIYSLSDLLLFAPIPGWGCD